MAIISSCRFSRVQSQAVQYSYNIDILPSMSNCTYIKGVQKCMDFPGCFYCLGLPTTGELRILSNVGDDQTKGQENREGKYTSEDLSRRLYSKIVPAYRNDISDDDLLTSGHCSEGFTGEDACAYVISASHNSQRVASVLSIVAQITCASFAMLLLLL